MARHINIVIDREMEAAVLAFAQKHSYTLSQAVRTLIRYGIGIVQGGKDAGMREGFTAAQGQVLQAVAKALQNLTPDPPPAGKRQR